MEEALRGAREEFGVGLDELDFEILTPGSRGVLGMGAEPARVLAAPRSRLAAQLPSVRPRPRFRCRPPPETRRSTASRPGLRTATAARARPGGGIAPTGIDPIAAASRPWPIATAAPAPPKGPARAPPGGGVRTEPRRDSTATVAAARAAAWPPPEGGPRPQPGLTAKELAEVAAARVAPPDRAPGVRRGHARGDGRGQGDPRAAHGPARLLVRVEIKAGETNRLNVVGEGAEKESLGALIGRKGERLSALQHLVNLLLSKKVGEWTRDPGRRRGLPRPARAPASRPGQSGRRARIETGKMLQLEPMPALERRWIHLALRDHERVATQSIGEEPIGAWWYFRENCTSCPRKRWATVVGQGPDASLPLWGVANDIGALIYHVEDGVTVTPGRASIARPGVTA